MRRESKSESKSESEKFGLCVRVGRENEGGEQWRGGDVANGRYGLSSSLEMWLIRPYRIGVHVRVQERQGQNSDGDAICDLLKHPSHRV